MASKLTAKQQRFCEEYLVDLNATQAAIRAGYSEKSARLSGHRNMTNDNIQALLQIGRKKLSQRTGVTAERVIEELALVAFTNMQDYIRVDADGQPGLDWKALTREQGAALSEVTTEVTVSGTRKTKFKLHSKMSALDLLGKHFGLFITKVEHTGADGEPLAIGISDMELKQRVLSILLNPVETGDEAPVQH